MTQITWQTDRRRLIDLKTWELNLRKISAQKFKDLKQKIIERGFHDVIVIDTDNTILSGNMRRKALVDLGIEEVSVLVPNSQQRNKVALKSNKHEGEWDVEVAHEMGRIRGAREPSYPTYKENFFVSSRDFSLLVKKHTPMYSRFSSLV